MSAIDNGKTTKVVYDEVDGTYRVTSLSHARRVLREAMSLVRIVIAGFLTYQGTQYLVYTIAIEELLLNAVALEFVITLDELIYESLAPAHTKRVTSRVIGFPIGRCGTRALPKHPFCTGGARRACKNHHKRTCSPGDQN